MTSDTASESNVYLYVSNSIGNKNDGGSLSCQNYQIFTLQNNNPEFANFLSSSFAIAPIYSTNGIAVEEYLIYSKGVGSYEYWNTTEKLAKRIKINNTDSNIQINDIRIDFHLMIEHLNKICILVF